MAELTESVKAKGVVQPILVRPAGEKFQIVAGERRYRASLVAFGSEGTIPAVIKPLTDEEAEVESLIENIHRADMSVTEEARAAGKCLARNKGDRDETARVLCWPIVKLARRLALLNLTEEVMTALDERKIQTGHAELLATVSKEKQNDALDRIIQHGMTVQFVRDNIVKKATKIAEAIFDAKPCAGCAYNSEEQASLFVENIGEGYCTNGTCYAEKTQCALTGIAAALEEEFPVVRIIDVGDDAAFVSLAAEGNLGVGEEQYAVCKGCGDFGATISALAGSVGTVTKSVCFNISCQQKKVAARIKSEQTATESTTATQEPKEATNGESAQTKQGTAPAPGKPDKIAPSAAGTSNRVKEYRRKIWNKSVKAGLAADPVKAMAYLFGLAMTRDLSKVCDRKAKELYMKIVGTEYPSDKLEGLRSIANLPQDLRDKLISALAVTTVDAVDEDRIINAVALLDTNLTDHWRINAEFLELLTKSEIEAVAVEVGLDKAMGDSFKKALAGKKDEAIKTILAAEFTWTGAVPKMMLLNNK